MTDERKTVSIKEVKPDVVVVELDMPETSANVLTTNLFDELEQAFSELQARDDLKGLILYSAKPSIFVAGADLNRINSTLDWPDEKIVQFCEDGRAIMSRLSKMPFITVAAIHGACVGGGLELALWCDYRIASDDRKTILGLPEVKLGLVPGWAGTVRLPRIANLESAVDLVTSGQVINGQTALQMGFADQVVAKGDLISTAVDLIENEDFESSAAIRENLKLPVERIGKKEEIQSIYLERIRANKEIYPLACETVLKHMLATAESSHDEACHSESIAMARVYGSEPSFGLLNNFFLGEHNKKNPGFVDVKLADREFSKIGIVGTGLMGKSIAANCIKASSDVVLYDASTEVLQVAAKELQELAAAKGVKCHTASSYDDLQFCDLVIESVVEVTEVKKTVLEKVSAAVSENTVIATNTSAIPLKNLAPAVKNPERFCGIHFCHPDLMLLVEVVRSATSSELTMANVTKWLRGLRKMPVVVNDNAGFVVNRMLAAMLDQAFRLYTQGYSIPVIDAAMREFGFLGGPFEIVDVIGTEVCMYAGREMFDGGVKCVTLSPILPRMVKQDMHGRRTGQGFYRYENYDSDPVWDEQINLLLKSYVDVSKGIELSSIEIAETICAAIALEASRLLDDKVVRHPKDIDICIVNGIAFPAHVGGILFWVDRTGIAKVNSILERLSRAEEKMVPSDRLLQMEKESTRFYG